MKNIVIDGEKFSDLEGFYKEILFVSERGV